MRELTFEEVSAVAGGAPLGSATAGEYFESCLGEFAPSNTVGTIWGLAGTFWSPAGWAAAGWSATALAVCSLGTLQYAQ